MDSAAVKESRRVLRQIQDHLYQAHGSLGVQRESVGLVDVLYHPGSTLASLNYVAPRRNTAWVSGGMIDQGLVYMRQLKRTPRVLYIEGLFPPLFARALRDLGLQPEWELPLMVYLKEGFDGHRPPPVRMGRLPRDASIEIVEGEHGAATWLRVWDNPDYDVITLGLEPLFAGRDHEALAQGKLIDVLICRGESLAGVARLSIQEDTAHLMALALKKALRSPRSMRRLLAAALRAALAQGCTIIYTSGDDEDQRRVAHTLGFLNFGSIVSYAASSTETREVRDDQILGQPVLALR